MKKIRVLRMMEYTFDSYEHMEKVFANGAVPQNGTRMFGTTSIRSATIAYPFDHEEHVTLILDTKDLNA